MRSPTTQTNSPREEQDEFAASSHQRAAAAWKNGLFDDEVAAVSIPQRHGDPVEFTQDEGIRADTTAESLARIPRGPAAGVLQTGTITAGNASSINDGAAAVVVMSKAKAVELGLDWLAEIGAHGVVAGPDSTLQTSRPMPSRRPAHRNALTRQPSISSKSTKPSPQSGLRRHAPLGLDPSKVNVNGGAIAIGHPIGMSGARIALHLALELNRRGGGAGAAACAVVADRDPH